MNNKIKILFYAPKAPPIGGIATWFDLISSNKPESFDYDFINSSVSLKRQKANGILKKCLSYIEMSNHFKELKKKISIFKPDILHIATSGKNGFLRDEKFIKYARRHGIKTVVHLHFGRTQNLFSEKSFESQNMKRVFSLADKIIAIDQITYNALLANGYEKKATFIPNPIKSQPYSYNLNSQKIMFVGTLNKNKGIVELISAFNLIDNKEYLLELYGPSDDEEEINNVISSNTNSNIIFKGEVLHDSLMNVYQNYSFLILPSYTEGMPYCILEAMSFGVPVIATSVGNIPNMVCDNRMLILPKSIEDLKHRILEYITNPALRKELSMLSYKKTQKEFSIESVVERMTKLWSTLYEN